jgi:hypothetical protein
MQREGQTPLAAPKSKIYASVDVIIIFYEFASDIGSCPISTCLLPAVLYGSKHTSSLDMSSLTLIAFRNRDSFHIPMMPKSAFPGTSHFSRFLKS